MDKTQIVGGMRGMPWLEDGTNTNRRWKDRYAMANRWDNPKSYVAGQVHHGHKTGQTQILD